MNDPFVLTSATKKLSVLVVESEYTISENFFDYLTSCFKNTTFENHEKQIFTHVESMKIDILIIDLNTKGINVFLLIEKIRKINPKLQVIMFSDEESREIFLKCIHYRVSAFLRKTTSLIQFKNEIRHIVDYLSIDDKKNELLDDNLVLEDSINFEFSVIDSLQYLVNNKHKDLSLINHYKGLPIIKKVSILDIEDNKLTVSVSKLNKYTLQHLKHTVFSSIHLGKEIYANLDYLDKENNIAVFKDLKFINSYIHHRKVPRIEPCNNIDIQVELNQHLYKFEIKDLTLNYVLFLVDELPVDFIINEKVKVHINLSKSVLDIETFEKHSFICQGRVDNIFQIDNQHKVLVYFKLEKALRNLLKIYINKRSTELIKEFKTFNKQL